MVHIYFELDENLIQDGMYLELDQNLCDKAWKGDRVHDHAHVAPHSPSSVWFQSLGFNVYTLPTN